MTPQGTPIDEVPDGTPTPLADTMTATSGDAGTYLFWDLPAGDHRIRIPASNFAAGQSLQSYPKSSTTPVAEDNLVDDDNNGAQPGDLRTEVWSPVITLSVGTEPTDGNGNEVGPGADQDNPNVAPLLVDANGDMTVDFGFKQLQPTAAALFEFAATWTSNGLVMLTWSTGVEFDLIGFKVSRESWGVPMATGLSRIAAMNPS